jgi:hypothetical protein
VAKRTLVHRATTILNSPPVNIPIRDDLLYQPKSQIDHPQPMILNLDAWLLSTDVSKQKAFKKGHTQNDSSKFKKFNN